MWTVENPSKFTGKYQTKSARLHNWDYSTPGFYFVTICTYNHNNFFGKIINEKMELSDRGQIVSKCINEIPVHFSQIIVTESIVMPNHIHLLLEIPLTSFNPVETHHGASLPKRYHSYFHHRIAIRSNQAIPNSISQFKSTVKRICKQQNIYFSWQPRFYDEIIHDEKRLIITRTYIQNNVKNWKIDKMYKE